MRRGGSAFGFSFWTRFLPLHFFASVKRGTLLQGSVL